MKKNKFLSRTIAAVLALLTLLPVSGLAAESTKDGTVPVTYDEAVYVTLDHYGNRKQLSVVKGVDLNGNRTFMDYGSYANVQNMSGYEKPEVTPDGVKWNLEEYDKSRMYFECTPSDQNAIVLPWDIKVTYQLNGVPTKAEELAGKSGTVEMVAECTANDGVNDYLKNNLLLELVTLVDTEQVLSVEAEGAQTQSLGKYKAVIFAALPGESTTFRIRVGTEHFSSLGLIMMMEPATLSQLEQLKELKAAKETIGDAPAVLLDGMSSMLRSIGGISDHLGEAGKGIDSMKQAYTDLQDYSSDIKAASAEAMAGFSELSRAVSAMMPYVDSISYQLAELKEALAALREKVSGGINGKTGEQAQAMLAEAAPELAEAQSARQAVNTEMRKLKQLADSVKTLAAGQPQMADSGNAIFTAVEEVDGAVRALDDGVAAVTAQQVELQQRLAALEDLSQAVQEEEILQKFEQLLGSLDGALQQARIAGEPLLRITKAAAQAFVVLADAISTATSSLNTGVMQVLDGLSGAAAGTAGLSETSNKLEGVGGTLQTAIDKVLNQFTEGNNLLNIDANAQRQSMTSGRNSAPSSLQIILRTETIGLEVMKEADPSENKTAQTPWARIKLVFQKIWKAISTLFE